MSYVAAEPGVLISPTDDLQSPRSAPAAHDENADGITGGTRDDSAPYPRFKLLPAAYRRTSVRVDRTAAPNAPTDPHASRQPFSSLA